MVQNRKGNNRKAKFLSWSDAKRKELACLLRQQKSLIATNATTVHIHLSEVKLFDRMLTFLPYMYMYLLDPHGLPRGSLSIHTSSLDKV